MSAQKVLLQQGWGPLISNLQCQWCYGAKRWEWFICLKGCLWNTVWGTEQCSLQDLQKGNTVEEQMKLVKDASFDEVARTLFIIDRKGEDESSEISKKDTEVQIDYWSVS
jgi:hypothetical protein